MKKLDIGVTLPSLGDAQMLETVGGIAGAARHVEDLGFESVWVPDVIVGDGTPSLEAVVVLAAASSATERISLGFSVLALPLRPIALLAAQIQSLQHVSGGRIVLGVGTGGFPGSPFWRAVNGPLGGLGHATDAALEALPGLIAGEPTRLEGDGAPLTLSPSAPVPPVFIGGNSDAALRRTARYGDGWFPSLITPAALVARIEALRALAAERDRTAPGVTVGGHATPGEDESARSARDALVQSLVGDHGMAPEEASSVPISGGPEEVSERLSRYANAGAERIVLSVDGDGWMNRLDLLAEAQAILES